MVIVHSLSMITNTTDFCLEIIIIIIIIIIMFRTMGLK